eukprot:Unigene16728_Nuclearia_a/m.49396 Unigene16728_Nuclearia_a/g.49396  ORF Unigene16728_Nuclearia_a/g.49396 Unigene16728_Nuclearia_a/m.49396 type:complete len:348 (+) Unigene16728_Nuclearia_a:25-1068(+)
MLGKRCTEPFYNNCGSIGTAHAYSTQLNEAVPAVLVDDAAVEDELGVGREVGERVDAVGAPLERCVRVVPRRGCERQQALKVVVGEQQDDRDGVQRQVPVVDHFRELVAVAVYTADETRQKAVKERAQHVEALAYTVCRALARQRLKELMPRAVAVFSELTYHKHRQHKDVVAVPFGVLHVRAHDGEGALQHRVRRREHVARVDRQHALAPRDRSRRVPPVAPWADHERRCGVGCEDAVDDGHVPPDRRRGERGEHDLAKESLGRGERATQHTLLTAPQRPHGLEAARLDVWSRRSVVKVGLRVHQPLQPAANERDAGIGDRELVRVADERHPLAHGRRARPLRQQH